MPGYKIDIELEGLKKSLQDLERMDKAITPRYLKTVEKRKSDKHFVPEMKAQSHSVRIQEMISTTTAKKFTSRLGVRVGVVKNDKTLFPKFSAQALASVIEYGTAERFRQIKKAGFVVERVSTGKMPASPWLRKAWDNNVEAFMNDVEKAIKRKVEKESGG